MKHVLVAIALILGLAASTLAQDASAIAEVPSVAAMGAGQVQELSSAAAEGLLAQGEAAADRAAAPRADSSAPRLADWMGDLLPVLGNLTLLDIVLPGTHDTLTHDLSRTVTAGDPGERNGHARHPPADPDVQVVQGYREDTTEDLARTRLRVGQVDELEDLGPSMTIDLNSLHLSGLRTPACVSG